MSKFNILYFVALMIVMIIILIDMMKLGMSTYQSSEIS